MGPFGGFQPPDGPCWQRAQEVTSIFLGEIDMGEASRRKQEYVTWFEALTEPRKLVAATAIATYERFVRPAQATGMCYRMSFFLKEFLAREHGIESAAVVGYVNDGTDDIMISHAWLEFEGTVTDITLAQTTPEVETGVLLVLDRALTRGRVTHTYHREKGEAGEAMEREIERDPRMGWIVAHKRKEHEHMVGLAVDPASMRAFLDAAPDGLDYEKLAAIVRK
jgi:hypothetical protein